VKNDQEAGYILPITVILVFILCAVIAEQTRYYLSEKQFFAAETTIFQLEELLQVAVVDLKQKNREELLSTSSLQYIHGTVICNVREIDEETLRIILQAKPKNGGSRYAHFLMNTNEGIITEWWEVTR